MWVEVEVKNDPESSTQWGSNQSGASCRSDQSEFWQFQFYRTSTSALPDQQVQLVILHRGVEFFFQRRQ
jgi:hypothetical protein